MDANESREVNRIVIQLLRFFNEEPAPILRPVFAGCGFIDASEGDVVFRETVYEIKTVDRPFRSSDLKQVLVYAALNQAAKQFNIQKVGLFNPRRALFCEIELDFVCAEISGRSANELLSILIQSVSSGEISR